MMTEVTINGHNSLDEKSKFPGKSLEVLLKVSLRKI